MISYIVEVFPEFEDMFWEYVYRLNVNPEHQLTVDDEYMEDNRCRFIITSTLNSYECFLNDTTFPKYLESIHVFE